MARLTHSESEFICPWCGKQSPRTAENCADCSGKLLLHDRWALCQVLGQNMGITYRAEDRGRDGAPVIVKELAIRRLDSWKTEELFQREINLLKQMNHAQVPRFVDEFTVGAGKKRTWYLVEEAIEGENLQARLEHHRFTELEVLDLLASALGALTYIHDLRPPIIHRDLKPSNLILRPDGEVVLIDFGCAKDLVNPRGMSDTVAGTFGYMAPEQFRGEATAASDLYAVGVIAVEMLAHKPPHTMVGDGNALHWRPHVHASAAMKRLIDKLVQNNPAERPRDARAALKLVERTRTALHEAAEAAEKSPASVVRAPVVRVPAARTPAVRAPAAKPARPSPRPQRELTPTPQPSRSSGWRPALLVASALTVVFGLGVALTLPPRYDGPPAGMATESAVSADALTWRDLPACTSGKCEPVPEGIRGLSFGQTLEQVATVLPEAGSAPHTSIGPWRAAVPEPVVVGSHAPGFALQVRTSLGPLPCTCELSFLVDDTLSRITCEAALGSQASHEAAERELLAGVVGKYGPPDSSQDHRPEYGFETEKVDRYFEWSSDDAKLSITSTYKSFEGFGVMNISDESLLRVDNVWARHEQALENLQREAERKAAAREAARERQAAEREQRELDQLRNSGHQIKDDL